MTTGTSPSQYGPHRRIIVNSEKSLLMHGFGDIMHIVITGKQAALLMPRILTKANPMPRQKQTNKSWGILLLIFSQVVVL